MAATAAAAAAADVQRPPRMQQHAGRGPQSAPRITVDREKTCPLLLRVFTKTGGHHTVEDFAVRGKEPKDEVQIYTWKDATLRELTDLVKEVAQPARRPGAKLSFALVYPDRRGRNVVRTVGTTFSQHNRRGDDDKMLHELDFQSYVLGLKRIRAPETLNHRKRMAQRVKAIVGRCGSAIREAWKTNLIPSRRTEGFMPTPIDRSSIRSLSHLNSRMGIKGFSSLAPAISSGGDVHAELGVKSVYKSSVRHDLAMVFTCKVCETRSAKTMCRETYEKGIVIIRCGGCKNLHLIADRLGWFGEKGSVEDFLAQQGVEVKRASEESYEFRLEDLVGRGASNEVAEGV